MLGFHSGSTAPPPPFSVHGLACKSSAAAVRIIPNELQPYYTILYCTVAAIHVTATLYFPILCHATAAIAVTAILYVVKFFHIARAGCSQTECTS